jgi:hypothetical protein
MQNNLVTDVAPPKPTASFNPQATAFNPKAAAFTPAQSFKAPLIPSTPAPLPTPVAAPVVEAKASPPPATNVEVNMKKLNQDEEQIKMI